MAIDINTFQNPYVKGGRVIPELARWYLNGSRKAPGMIHADDVVVRAFADIGWERGGDWNSLKDYQHFSENGT
ncbi:M15 family metallopeptidase [Nocardioides sp. NPDC057764]|uniref:M15 family metallopeptidase n=1 Tax=Nocardioides sp. NPDC057764 TaxID=3346243 RepID=UPI00367257A7